MKKEDEYNEYCIMVTSLDAKEAEKTKIVERERRLDYEIDSLKKDIKHKIESLNLSLDTISNIKTMRMRNCLSGVGVIELASGGSIGSNPIVNFKKSDDFKSFTAEQKKLFKKINTNLTESQYNLQNAIQIGQGDDESFNVHQSTVIEDFIDELMTNIEDYDNISVKNLKQIKEIIYIFVEQVSKN
jgi:hypothetical protein